MPDLPQHLKEEIKQIVEHQAQVELMKMRAVTPMSAMPLTPMTPMPGMPHGRLHHLKQQMQMPQMMVQAASQGTLAFSQTPLPPAIALPTPRLAIQAAQPAPSASKRVELELWPTNGYSEKKNHRDPMFFTVEVRHVVCSMRNRLMCDDVTSLWALRIEDHCVKQFHSEEQLAVVRQFVGQQRVIMFYDDEIAGRIPQRDAYVVHSNFKSHTGP